MILPAIVRARHHRRSPQAHGGTGLQVRQPPGGDRQRHIQHRTLAHGTLARHDARGKRTAQERPWPSPASWIAALAGTRRSAAWSRIAWPRLEVRHGVDRMKYGEIQAIVQLAVAFNVGIFALMDLVGPYIDRLILDLENFHREFKDRGQASSDKSADITSYYINIARSNRKIYDKYAFLISMAGVVATFISLWMLIDTARFYSDTVPAYFYTLLIGVYIPTFFGLITVIFTRWLVSGMYPNS
ncbi:hypothetical protein [Methylobacterium indicum]|uniref:hypothetical protein n=1 Tax=Methylobacterium indicum TaxID=1775910 RepID=UPI0015D0474D|nr:hypothetical protein [Methylobacterium indicum]